MDSASTLTMGAALDEPVLLLNRLYAAVRIVSARRAFSLLCKQLAEVIAVEEEGMRTYDFADWCDIADVRRELEGDQYRWVKNARLELPVPQWCDSFPMTSFQSWKPNCHAATFLLGMSTDVSIAGNGSALKI